MWLSSILWLLLGLARGSVAGDVRKSISRHPRGSAGGGWQRRNSTAHQVNGPYLPGPILRQSDLELRNRSRAWVGCFPRIPRKEAHIIPLCGGSQALLPGLPNQQGGCSGGPGCTGFSQAATPRPAHMLLSLFACLHKAQLSL